MTPIETPQSSEDTPPLPGESNDGSIRVRNVGELNEDNNDNNEAESAPFTAIPVKRRCLPSWMLPTANKKQKQHSGNSEKPESTVASSPSTSTAHAVADNDNTDDSSNQNNAETSCDTTSTPKDSEINKNDANDEIKDENIIQALVNEIKSLEDDEGTVDAGGIDDIASSSNQTPATSNVQIKTEPQDDDHPTVGQITPSTSNDIKPAIKVEKEEATSSTTRDSCKFGIRCYRRNPMHRQEEAHPGDSDYRRPDFPPPPDDAPPCQYGDLCYRRNPVHFQQFTHPPSTDFKQNWKAHQMRLRERKQKQQQSQKDETGSDVDESEDFYYSSDEYKIGDELDEDDDDDDDEDDFY